MNDSLSISEIKKRGLSGAKWFVVMNGIGMPAAFLIALFLGRVGPEALGAYALAQMLVGVVTTFVIFGGQTVLSVFMPKIPDAETRGRFLFSYLLVILGIGALIVGLFGVFPGFLEFLLRRRFNMAQYGWFVLLAFAVVVSETLANAASGLMLIKVTAIARYTMRFVLLPVVAVLVVFGRRLLADSPLTFILGGFLAGYLLASLIATIGIWREERFSMRFGWFLPRGFWTFSLSTMGATISTFVYSNFDRIAVLAIQDMEGLGKYQAVLSADRLLQNVPDLFRPSVVPTLSNLLGAQRTVQFERACSLLSRWTVIPITLAALFVMGFSRHILGLFGEGYAEYHYLLTLFGLVSILRSLNLCAFSVTTCMEKNAFRFLHAILAPLFQAVLTLLLLAPFGVLGIAGAKMISAAAAALAAIAYVYFGIFKTGVPLPYKAAALSGGAMAVARLAIPSQSWLVSGMLAVAAAVLFILFSKVTMHELAQLARLILKRDRGIVKSEIADSAECET